MGVYNEYNDLMSKRQAEKACVLHLQPLSLSNARLITNPKKPFDRGMVETLPKILSRRANLLMPLSSDIIYPLRSIHVF
jgi:hypothetical protein